MVYGRRVGSRRLSMGDVLHLLVDLDHDAIRATGELRWAPATALLALVSAWWVKGPLLVAVGWGADLRCGRRFPLVALAAGIAFFVASGLNAVVKALVDRDRPPEAIGFDALVGVPVSPSFPSGHAMSAAAVYMTVAYLAARLQRRRLSRSLTLLAAVIIIALIAVSRLYLGVHYPTDVAAGVIIGIAWAALCMAMLETTLLYGRRRSARMRAAEAPSPRDEEAAAEPKSEVATDAHPLRG